MSIFDHLKMDPLSKGIISQQKTNNRNSKVTKCTVKYDAYTYVVILSNGNNISCQSAYEAKRERMNGSDRLRGKERG